MAWQFSWLERQPVTLEVVGSSPIQVASCILQHMLVWLSRQSTSLVRMRSPVRFWLPAPKELPVHRILWMGILVFSGTFFRPHPFSQFSVKGCGLFMKQKITFREQLKRDPILSLHSMTNTTQNCCKYAHEATCNSSNLFFRHIFFLTNPLMCCIIKKEIQTQEILYKWDLESWSAV